MLVKFFKHRTSFITDRTFYADAKMSIFGSKTIHILTIGLAVLFMAQCSSGQEVSWKYTVPDNYEGYLVVQYDCEGGKPLDVIDGVVNIVFSLDGTSCIKDSFESVFPNGTVSLASRDIAQTSSGLKIPIVSPYRGKKGIALTSLSNRRLNRDGREYNFSILWVGDMQKLDRSINTGAAQEHFDAFLETRYGIKPPELP